MPLRVLIAPDKFKGTITAGDAAKAIARGWRIARPWDALELLPITDGGDGFGEVISQQIHAAEKTVRTVDAAHRRCRATWWWESKRKIALIESANIIGLAGLPRGKFHPFDLDTFGLGAAIHAAAERGARRCWMGIGGSATNDGGFGVARALGWKFLDRAANEITRWTDLEKLVELHPPDSPIRFEEFVVAVDVQNKLLGARGCSRVYGPQKGLRPADFPQAERCLRRLSLVVEKYRKKIHGNKRGATSMLANEPGAGAAGGLGFGLRFFAGAQLRPGFELFAGMSGLDAKLRSADLVITGEGAIDASTLMGKGVGEIAARCVRLKIPCVGIGGRVTLKPGASNNPFAAQFSLMDFARHTTTKKNTARWLEKLAEHIAVNSTR